MGKASELGFTLIELMIVVAILGILASIAIPQYHLYTGKAQLAEAIHVAEGPKSAIAEAIQANVPLASINGGAVGIPSNVGANAGRYVESLVIGNGDIVATMKMTNVSPCVVGATVTVSPVPPLTTSDPVRWLCKTTATCKPLTCND